jgi:molybdopterin synthase sulfur carrier subunit
MPVRIQIPTPMRQHTEGKAVVLAAGDTIKAALEDLGRQFPGITQRLFENGQVRRFVNVYLNDEDIRYLDNLSTSVKDGDELSIIPAVAGG